MSRVDVGQVTNMNDIEALEERVTSAENNLDSEIDKREEQITELKNDLSGIVFSALPSKSASGSVITFADGAYGAALKSLVLNLEPHQSGTGDPSPNNIRQISGYDAVNVVRYNGKNVFNPNANVGKWIDANGNIVSSTANSAVSDRIYINSSVQTACIFIKDEDATGTLLVAAYDRNDNLLVRNAVSGTRYAAIREMPADTNYLLFAKYNAASSVCALVNSLSNATFYDYTEDTITTCPISLSSAGTVYGGSLDVTTGELVVDRTMIAVKNMEWSRTTSYAHPVFYVNQNEKAITYQKGACSFLRDIGRANIVSAQNFADYAENGDFALCSNNIQIFVRYDDITDVSTFKTQFEDETFVYPLAAPITYHLTPTEVTTLLGDNTIWMNAKGTVELTYRADTQMYVDNRVKATQGIIAPVEDSNTATANYAIGDYLIVEDTLYKVTAAIASGGTITPDTNVTATTVMAQIKALT